MKFWISISILLFLIMSCSSQNKSNSRSYTGADGSAVKNGEIDENSSDGATDSDDDEKKYNIVPIPLSKKSATGTKLRLLSPNALDKVYARVFKRRANGHFGYGCPDYFIYDCKDSFFTNAEASSMSGSYLTRNITNFKQPDNITLNYLRNLRAMLRRECMNISNSEWNALERGGSPEDNTLVTVQGPPPKAVFDRFLRRLLGINGLDIKIDTAAAEYRKAFEESLKLIPEEEEINRADYINVYTNVCIAIAMDPRIILY